MKEIKPVKVIENMEVDELIKRMGEAGMGGRKLSEAIDVIESMANDKYCSVFLGLAGALVPAGMKGLIIEMIENEWVNVLVTTGATLTHDLVEALGGKHFQGDERADDFELQKKGFDRMWDVLMSNDVYVAIEDFLDKHLDELKKAETIQEFLKIVGSKLDENSILGVAYKKNIPIYSPAFIDSGFAMILAHKGININQFKDLSDFLEKTWEFKKKGFIYLGGGVPKNYIQQSLQFSSKGGADYGVQITMDRVETGGSSGAEVREGISWGKLRENAKYVDLRADVIIALPLIVASLKKRIKKN
ncbi:MAG: deoxyhypusine synthase [Nanoarchaeota archaeon]|nr:deoxyhypusine synthase [Nanoarchaeota archaeon]